MKNREKEVDHIVDKLFYYDENTGFLLRKKYKCGRALAGAIVGYSGPGKYLRTEINNKQFFVHRVIWRIYYGTWPKHEIDHINGNRLDNRIENLRDITSRQNSHNYMSHRNGKKFGCYLEKRVNKYRAQISLKRKRFHIGYYKTELEAHEQYLRALKAIETREFKSAKELRNYLSSTNKRAEV